MKHVFPRSLIGILLAFIMCDRVCNSSAQDWAKERVKLSPRHSEYVDIKSGSRTIWVRVVYPESKEKTPAVLVVHEIFGMTD